MTWRSGIAVRATPERVLDTLTDIEACEAWSPVRFDVDCFDSRRLRTGSRLRVSGRVAGLRTCFRVEILEASSGRLVLSASGPLEVVADYAVSPAPHGSQVEAVISLHPGSPRSWLVGQATALLLAAGALSRALAGIAREAERRGAPEEL